MQSKWRWWLAFPTGVAIGIIALSLWVMLIVSSIASECDTYHTVQLNGTTYACKRLPAKQE